MPGTHCFSSGIATPPMRTREVSCGVDARDGEETRAEAETRRRYMNFFVLFVAAAWTGSSGQKCLGYRPASSLRTST